METVFEEIVYRSFQFTNELLSIRLFCYPSVIEGVLAVIYQFELLKRKEVVAEI